MVVSIFKYFSNIFIFLSTFTFSQSYYEKLNGKKIEDILVDSENQIIKNKINKCKVSISILNDLKSENYKTFFYIQNYKNEDHLIIAIGKYYFNRKEPYFVILEVFIYDQNEKTFYPTRFVFGKYELSFDINSLKSDFRNNMIYKRRLIKSSFKKK